MAPYSRRHPLHQLARAAALSVFAVLTSGSMVASRAQTGAAAQKPTAAPNAPPTAQTLAKTECSACHGPDGNSPDPQYPKIAGQKASYLELQLRGFKYGGRRSDVMSPLAKPLSDKQIAALARLYSRQPVKPDMVKDRELADLGRRIFTYPGRGVPACAACHGGGGYGRGMMMGGRGGMMGGGMMHGGMMGGMMGNPAFVPRLFGQHAGYTVQQLDTFASGKRHATVMGPIAARLSPHERQAVAAYLAGRR